LTKGTKKYNGDEIKGLKWTFYELWDQSDTKKIIKGRK